MAYNAQLPLFNIISNSRGKKAIAITATGGASVKGLMDELG